jgi:hypothetical protein
MTGVTRAATDALRQGIDDPDDRVSVVCAFSLWFKSKDRATLERIIAFLAHADDRVRKDAAGCLSQIIREMAPSEHVGPLAKHVKAVLRERVMVEEHPTVRFWIEEALRGFEGQ